MNLNAAVFACTACDNKPDPKLPGDCIWCHGSGTMNVDRVLVHIYFLWQCRKPETLPPRFGVGDRVRLIDYPAEKGVVKSIHYGVCPQEADQMYHSGGKQYWVRLDDGDWGFAINFELDE